MSQRGDRLGFNSLLQHMLEMLFQEHKGISLHPHQSNEVTITVAVQTVLVVSGICQSFSYGINVTDDSIRRASRCGMVSELSDTEKLISKRALRNQAMTGFLRFRNGYRFTRSKQGTGHDESDSNPSVETRNGVLLTSSDKCSYELVIHWGSIQCLQAATFSRR